MQATVTTVMCDTTDLDRSADFWTAVLGLEVVHRQDDYCYLDRLDGEQGPRLAFQLVPEPRGEKNRMHLDLRVPDRAAFEARVVQLGGAVHDEVQQEGFPVWRVCSDPEGNRFCIYEAQQPATADG